MSINFKQITLGMALLTILSANLFSSPAIARKPTPPNPPPTDLPSTEPPLFPGIQINTFNYENGGLDFPENPLNAQYFNGCFRKVYSVLGAPATNKPSSATTGISPVLTLMQVTNLDYIAVIFRYAARNNLKVYLITENPINSNKRTDLVATLDRTSGYCSSASIDLTSRIKTISTQFIAQNGNVPLLYSIRIENESGLAGFSDFAVNIIN
jgi:hypothetical protein